MGEFTCSTGAFCGMTAQACADTAMLQYLRPVNELKTLQMKGCLSLSRLYLGSGQMGFSTLLA